jgi:hypothetical protein
MPDRFYILRDGRIHEARRYLREDGGRTYQTVFYRQSSRCDPAGYAQFASDDSAMNVAAEDILAAMVEEAARLRTTNRHSAHDATGGPD